MESSNRDHEQISGEDSAVELHTTDAAPCARADVPQPVPIVSNPTRDPVPILWCKLGR